MEKSKENMDLIIQTVDALSSKKTMFVKRYAKTGMSAGLLHHGFWIETALPLLLRRLELVNKSCTE